MYIYLLTKTWMRLFNWTESVKLFLLIGKTI